MAGTQLRKRMILLLAALGAASLGSRCGGPGLDPLAEAELRAVGLDRYVGQFAPETEEPSEEGWTRHTFDTDGGDGPLCIDGSPFTVFTKENHPAKLMIFFDGGGACWQNFYFCSFSASSSPPGPDGVFAGAFDTGSEVIDNPLADYSMMFVSYCDGSVFSGDHEVVDPNFPLGPMRFHRGIRNMTAALDLAHEVFPQARSVLMLGESAGGVGASGYGALLARLIFGNLVALRVLNDAGPVAINLGIPPALEARAHDWQFGQFFPPSCTSCSAFGQPAEIISWRLSRDSNVIEAFVSTDADSTNRFFLAIPTAEAYRQLLLDVHDPIHEAYPERYKRFLVAGEPHHTVIGNSLFYLSEADGVPLHRWIEDFARNRRGRASAWIDLVEDAL